jgi:hypothetical protein
MSYSCEKCNFATPSKTKYTIHCSTRKHLQELFIPPVTTPMDDLTVRVDSLEKENKSLIEKMNNIETDNLKLHAKMDLLMGMFNTKTSVLKVDNTQSIIEELTDKNPTQLTTSEYFDNIVVDEVIQEDTQIVKIFKSHYEKNPDNRPFHYQDGKLYTYQTGTWKTLDISNKVRNPITKSFYNYLQQKAVLWFKANRNLEDSDNEDDMDMFMEMLSLFPSGDDVYAKNTLLFS